MFNFIQIKFSAMQALLAVALTAPTFLIVNTASAGNYTFEPYVTLEDIVADLNDEGYFSLASDFESLGFHPDGIKMGKACTATQGKLYVSSIATGSVLEIAADGTVRPYVNPKPSDAYGVVLDQKGNLFVSYISRLSNVGGIDVVPVGATTPADGQTCYSIPNASVAINDLAITKDGKTLFFTDDAGGRIFRCDVSVSTSNVSCNCSQWLKSTNTASLLGLFGGVDGIVIGDDQKTLYFNNFLKKKIWKVEIRDDGTAGKETALTPTPLFGVADGMSLSADIASVYTATFRPDGGIIAETDIATGTTQTLIEDVPSNYIDQGSALAVDSSGSYETLYISSVDVYGMLLGYKNIGSDGGKIVKATLYDRPQTNHVQCPLKR